MQLDKKTYRTGSRDFKNRQLKQRVKKCDIHGKLNNTQLIKDGYTRIGSPRYRCKECNKERVFDYNKKYYLNVTKPKLIKMGILNG